MTLPELIFSNKKIDIGSKKGECIVCGKYIENGFNYPFSDNFVGFNALKYGNVLCPECYNFFRNQDFRKRNFIATINDIQFLKRDEIKNILLEPPNPPFFIYITKSYQKQGWINDFNKISFSRDRFYLSTDFFESAFLVEKIDIIKYNSLIEFLMGQSITKTELLTGIFKSKSYMKAKNENFLDKLTIARNKAGMPLWEVLVYVN